MVRTRVGYTGGTKKNPTYHALGDHTESIQIDYDPERISYRELLELYWKSHNPCSRPWSRQYMAAVFYHDPSQKRLAEETRDRMERELGCKIHTVLLPASTFYLAEGYHQKYALRQCPDLLKAYQAIYPDLSDFLRSTAVTRVNGYLGGHGDAGRFEKEKGDLGLSPEDLQKLEKRLRLPRTPSCR